jgi:separase
LLSIPKPSSLPEESGPILSLTSTYFAHAVSILTHLVFNTSTQSSPSMPDLTNFASQFSPDSPGCFLSWISNFVQGLETKQLDPILSRIYTTLTKACALAIASASSPNPNPGAIFILRIFASHFLLYTSPGVIEPKTFWDQVIKFGAVLTKSTSNGSEEDALRTVLKAFGGLVKRLEHADEDRKRFMDGRGWFDFCDYWMGFSRKARIYLLSSKTSIIGMTIGRGDPPGGSNCRPRSSFIFWLIQDIK